MKSLCQTKGHSYAVTSEGKSRRCVFCGRLRWPWSREELPAPIPPHLVTFDDPAPRTAALLERGSKD